MGKKKVKDPLAPKPPLNSYMEFALEERIEVLKDLGQVSIKEVGKEIGSRWKKLDEEAKQKYVLKSRQNQELYKIEKQKYEQNKPVEQNEYPPSDTMMNQKKKKKKHPLAPKLPLSSYMEFAKEQRPKVLSDLGNLSLGEVGKELGRQWQKLGELEKSVYEDKYRENRAKYKAEKEAFDNNLAKDQENSGLDPPEHIPANKALSSPQQEDQSISEPNTIKLEHLGFAQGKGFSWHPALKTDVLARGTRVKITFFGTGEQGTVDKKNWIVFSEQSLAKMSAKLVKTAPFQTGLGQLRSLRDKILSDATVTSSGIGFTPQMGSRRFRSLDKEHLQTEEMENTRQMEKKMFLEGGGKLWRCRDCGWKGQFRHRAKAHSRDCGQRKRATKRRCQEKKYECSNGVCLMVFAKRSQLLKHYRYRFHIFFYSYLFEW